MLELLREHEGLLWWLGAVSVAGLVLSVVLLPVFIARIPDDYFAARKAPRPTWHDAHPCVYWSVKVGKNALGVLLILAGIAMLVLPGQGILAIVLGLMLLEFPGKRRLELGLMHRERLRGALNWIRKRAGKAPLRVYGVRGARDEE